MQQSESLILGRVVARAPAGRVKLQLADLGEWVLQLGAPPDPREDAEDASPAVAAQGIRCGLRRLAANPGENELGAVVRRVDAAQPVREVHLGVEVKALTLVKIVGTSERQVELLRRPVVRPAVSTNRLLRNQLSMSWAVRRCRGTARGMKPDRALHGRLKAPSRIPVRHRRRTGRLTRPAPIFRKEPLRPAT